MKKEIVKPWLAKVHGYNTGSYSGSYVESFDSLDEIRVWAKQVGKKGDVLEISEHGVQNPRSRRIEID